MTYTSDFKRRFGAAAAVARRGDTADAAALYRGMVDDFGHDKASLGKIAQGLAAVGHAEDAIALIERVLSQGHASPLLISRLVTILQRAGREEEAQVALRRWGALLPDVREKLMTRGRTALAERRYADAWSAFAHVLDADPAYADAVYGAAKALRKLGREEEVIEVYARAIQIPPTNPFVLEPLAIMLVERSRYDEAEALLTPLVRPKATFLRCYVLLAGLLFQRAQLMEALTAINTAIRLDGRNAEAYRIRGNILISLNQPVLAAMSFDRALVETPDDIPSLLGKGLAEANQKNYPAAFRLAEQVLALDPRNKVAKSRIRKWGPGASTGG